MDCTTLAPGLAESELFGHVKGAFTSSVQNKTGLFDAARNGTLFLDDIANLSMEAQAKLRFDRGFPSASEDRQWT